jgi:ribosomal protein S18 acetylase RimI-like enzyme
VSGDRIEIADATPDDAEAILALQKLAYESEAQRYQDWTIPPLVETADTVRRQIAEQVVLKAIVDGRLAGSVRGVVTDGVCEVCRLSVDPALQRRGIGSALIEAIEARFPAIDAFELFTGDRSVENLRLYERHGYRQVRTEVVSPDVSLVYLRKPGPHVDDEIADVDAPVI